MRRALMSLFLTAFLSFGMSACAERPPARVVPAVDARVMDFADQAGAAAKPGGPTSSKIDAAAKGEGEPADALRLILLQLLVGR